MTKKAELLAAVTTILLVLYYSIVGAAGEEKNRLVFQGKTFSANLVEESLKNVFEKLRKQTEIRFRIPDSCARGSQADSQDDELQPAL